MNDSHETINELVQRLSMLLVSLVSDSVPVAAQLDAMEEAKELSETLAALVHNRLQEPDLATALYESSVLNAWDSLADATLDAAAQLGL